MDELTFTVMTNELSVAVVPVSMLNQRVADLLAGQLPPMWVSGEVSNLTRAASGHWYFVLKDEHAQVRCVMFRHKAQYVAWPVSNGDKVELYASAGLYAARGEFQLSVDSMRQAGRGALFAAYEALKQRLQAAGLFDPDSKRALPAHPAAIGVITSPQAAALRDVLTALRRRAPHIPVILYPAPVQGDGAAPLLRRAIEQANDRAEVSVLILCRGGGSIEDLWAFNDEALAHAIAASRIPLVSGVGHETDFTIADFVADVRAATPTAAAELVSPDGLAMRQHLGQLQRRLQRAVARQLEPRMQQLDYLTRRLLHPGQRIAQQQVVLQQWQQRWQRAGSQLLQQRQHHLQQLRWRWQACRPDLPRLTHRLSQLQSRLSPSLQRQLQSREHRLNTLAARLQALDPAAVLARGYSLVTTASGQVVRHPGQVRAGDALHIQLAEGQLQARVSPPAPQQQALPLELPKTDGA